MLNDKKPVIVFAASGHSPFSSRLYDKELRSLRKKYEDLIIVAPYDNESTTEHGIKIIGISRHKSRFNRFSSLRILYKKLLELSPDILHCHEPDSLFICFLLKYKIQNVKVIYDCHEFHPQSFTEEFPPVLNAISKYIIEKVENYLVSKVDAIVTVNDRLGDRFAAVNTRVAVLPNYPKDEIVELAKNNIRRVNENIFRLVYVGLLSADRGLLEMLKLVQKLVARGVPAKLTIAGKFSSAEIESQYQDFIREQELSDYVDYLGVLAHSDTIVEIAKSDVGLFLLTDRERYQWTEATKYFEYAACGVPCVFTDLFATRKLIEKNENGIIVPPDNLHAAVDAVCHLYENRKEAVKMGERGREAFRKYYTWEKNEERLFELYNELLLSPSLSKQ